jgi:RNA polymerase sigma factor (sigma-70 family)
MMVRMAGTAWSQPARAARAAGLDDLVERVLAGDPAAWQELAGRVHPAALAICRRRRLGADHPGEEDLHHEVAARALDRLAADDFAALRRFTAARARYPEASFLRWLAVVVKNTFIDHMRAQPEYQRRRQAAARKLVRLDVTPLDEESTAGGGRAELQNAVEVRRILEWLLDARFPSVQRRAILLWLDGNGPGEIAEELALAGPREASRLLHAARQRLRRRFER